MSLYIIKGLEKYFSPIFQRQRLFCYCVAIVIINGTTTTNKKSFSVLP